MKVVAVITLISAVQASASFFDGFQSSFVSVENSFGKLIDDVVSDVKVKIDCTIGAVEKALSLGGLFGDYSEYERRCKGENAYNQPTEVQNTDVVAPSAVYEIITAKPTENEKQSVKREIKPSMMVNVHDKIKNILVKPNSLDGLDTVKTNLKKETNKLDNVGSVLIKQLDDITSDAKIEVDKIGDDSALTADDVLKKIKLLHTVSEEKSNSEDSQINHAFDEVMDAIHSNATTVSLTDNYEAKEIMKDLEETSNNTFTDIKTTYSQFRNEEHKHLDDLEDIVESKTKDLRLTTQKDTARNDAPKSFKTLVQQIMDEKMNEDQTQEETTESSVAKAPVGSISYPAPVPRKVDKENPVEVEVQPTVDPEVLLFNACFGANPDAEGAASETMSFIQQSRYSQMLMESVLSSDDAVDVFDNPELLNYR